MALVEWQAQPAELGHLLPDIVGKRTAFLAHPAHQRRGALALEEAACRVLDLLLFLIEIQFHRSVSGGSGAR